MHVYILKYGLIVGLINVLGLVSLIFNIHNSSFLYSESISYTLMLIAFAFVYLGVKSYRDALPGSSIGFGKAFMLGLLIVLVGATLYVVAWLIIYGALIPDFMEKYAEACSDSMKKNGSSDFDIAEKMKEISMLQDLYKNPFMIVLITYAEILPIGIVASVVSSLVLRKRLRI